MQQQTEEEPTTLLVKLYLTKEHIRRFSAPSTISFEELQQRIGELYSEFIPQQTTFNLQYCDDDEEWTILKNEDDWYCCKAICRGNIKVRCADFWQVSLNKLKVHQQAFVTTFNREKNNLKTKGEELCRQVDQELKKIGSNEEVKKIEQAVQNFCTQLFDQLSPLIESAAITTNQIVSSVVDRTTTTTTNEAASEESSSSPLIKLTDEEDDEEPIPEQIVTTQPTENNVLEKSGFVWVNNGATPVQPIVQQEPIPEPVVEEPVAEPIPEPVEVPVVEPVVEQPVVVPYAEELRMLSVMGFSDTEKNVELLQKFKGNVAFVVDALLSM